MQLVTNKPFLIPRAEQIQPAHTAQEESGTESCVRGTSWDRGHPGRGERVAYIGGGNAMVENELSTYPNQRLSWPSPSSSTRERSGSNLLSTSFASNANCWCNSRFQYRLRTTCRDAPEERRRLQLIKPSCKSGAWYMPAHLFYTIKLPRYTWLDPFCRLGNWSWLVQWVIQAQTPKTKS